MVRVELAFCRLRDGVPDVRISLDELIDELRRLAHERGVDGACDELKKRLAGVVRQP